MDAEAQPWRAASFATQQEFQRTALAPRGERVSALVALDARDLELAEIALQQDGHALEVIRQALAQLGHRVLEIRIIANRRLAHIDEQALISPVIAQAPEDGFVLLAELRERYPGHRRALKMARLSSGRSSKTQCALDKGDGTLAGGTQAETGSAAGMSCCRLAPIAAARLDADCSKTCDDALLELDQSPRADTPCHVSGVLELLQRRDQRLLESARITSGIGCLKRRSTRARSRDS